MPTSRDRGLRYTRRVSRYAGCVSLLACSSLLLAACSVLGGVQPTVKIGLSAPFEGLYRDQGYEALYAVRLAMQQRNEAGGVGDRYLIELVALNDFGEAKEAVVQSRKMAVDPDVLGVLGGLTAEAASASVGEYRELGLALLVPPAGVVGGIEPVQAGAEFTQEYQAQSGGALPGPIALWAYESANRVLDAVDMVVRAQGRPTRGSVLSLLEPDGSP